MDGTRRDVIRAGGILAMLPVFAGCAQQEGRTEMSSTEASNKALAEDRFKAWSDGTGSPYELLADDAEWTIVGKSHASRTYHGREDFMREVIRPFNARMQQSLKPTIRGLFADGDSVVIFFDASGIAKDGVGYTNTYSWIWQMQDGRITKAHAFFDSIAFNDLWERVQPA